MTSDAFDLQTILIVAGAVLALLIAVWLVLRFARRRQSIAQDLHARIADPADPYAVDRARPYAREGQTEARPVPPSRAAAEPAPVVEVPQPAIPLPGDIAGIAFPPGSTDRADDLTRLKGVGPKLAAMLNDQGITRYEQLASLGDAELAALDAQLGTFNGRLARDRVTEQARLLASGDTETFEAQFGKLG